MKKVSDLNDDEKLAYLQQYSLIEPKIDQWANHIFDHLGEGKAITNYDSLLSHLRSKNANIEDPNQKVFYCWAIFKAMLFQGNPLPAKERMFIIAMLMMIHQFKPEYSNEEYFYSNKMLVYVPHATVPYIEKLEVFRCIVIEGDSVKSSKYQTWDEFIIKFSESLLLSIITSNPSKFRVLNSEVTGKPLDDVFIEKHLLMFLVQQKIMQSVAEYSQYVAESFSDYSWLKLADDSDASFRKQAITLLDNYTRNSIPLVGGLFSRATHFFRGHRGHVSVLRDTLQSNSEKYQTKNSIKRFLLESFCDHTNGWDADLVGKKLYYFGSYAKRICQLVDSRIDFRATPDKTFITTKSSTRTLHKNMQEDLMAQMTLLSVVGVGSFGAIYVVKVNGLKVAMKAANILQPESKIDVINEIKVLHTLSHPNIIHVYGACAFENGYPAMLMEFSEKGSLFDYISKNQKTPISMLERLSYVVDVVSGLKYCHAVNIIHRDIKPHNVLLLLNGKIVVAKIADFGMAISTDAVQDHRRGAPFYAAPEISFASGDPRVHCTASSDNFALGLMIKEIALGKFVIGENWQNTRAQILPHITQDTPVVVAAALHAVIPVLVDDPTRRPTARELELSMKQIHDDEMDRQIPRRFN